MAVAAWHMPGGRRDSFVDNCGVSGGNVCMTLVVGLCSTEPPASNIPGPLRGQGCLRAGPVADFDNAAGCGRESPACES